MVIDGDLPPETMTRALVTCTEAKTAGQFKNLWQEAIIQEELLQVLEQMEQLLFVIVNQRLN